jgi:hypothetical protein
MMTTNRHFVNLKLTNTTGNLNFSLVFFHAHTGKFTFPCHFEEYTWKYQNSRGIHISLSVLKEYTGKYQNS